MGYDIISWKYHFERTKTFMIQDIYPHIYHNEYIQKKPSGDSFFLFYDQQAILTGSGSNKLRYFTMDEILKEFPHLKNDLTTHAIYLFAIDDRDFFLYFPQNAGEEVPSHSDVGEMLGALGTFKPLSILRSTEPAWLAFAGITGHQLNSWYLSRKFCGRCGHELVHADRERMMHCPQCNVMEYPVLSPAVIVGVTHNDRLLLTKYEGRSFKRYALIAGYAEIGETIEETVHREVMEEVGLKVKNIRYYKSQPWSFSGTLLFGFFCDLDGNDEITLDTTELSTARWFKREDIPADGENTSLTREMMLYFKSQGPAT